MPKGHFEFARYWVDRIEVGERSECWRWTGAHDEKGYPRVRLKAYNGPVGRVHRMVAELVHGSAGRVVHHRCENPGCVNPEHLEVIKTNSEHTLIHQQRDCGHDDWYIRPQGWRCCRECRRIRERAKAKERGSWH